MARGDFHRRSQEIADVTTVVLRFSCLIISASLERAIGRRIAPQLGIAAKESRVKVGVSREIIVRSASGKRRKEARSGRTQRQRKRIHSSLSLSLSLFSSGRLSIRAKCLSTPRDTLTLCQFPLDRTTAFSAHLFPKKRTPRRKSQRTRLSARKTAGNLSPCARSPPRFCSGCSSGFGIQDSRAWTRISASRARS